MRAVPVSKRAVLRTRLVVPYSSNGRTSFPARQRSGVYLIFRGPVLRYVGFSQTDVYKSLYRHFEQWNDASRSAPRVTYGRGPLMRVRVVYTRNGSQAARLERALILRHRPPDNVVQYDAFVLDDRDRELMQRAAVSPFADTGPAPF